MAPRHQRTLLALGLTLLVVPSVHSAESGEGAPLEPDRLWFRPPDIFWGLKNFTTVPPTGEGFVDHPHYATTHASWSWAGSVPADWWIPAGTEIVLVAYVERLEETDPVLMPTGDLSQPLGVSFEAQVHHRGRGGVGGELARGFTVVPIDLLDRPAGIQRVAVHMTVEEASLVSAREVFSVDLQVYARGRNHHPLRLALMGEEAATHLVAPGFPVAAFRAWEEQEPPRGLCMYQRWQRLPCTDGRVAGRDGAADDGAEVSSAVGEAGSGIVPGVGLLGWAALRGIRRGRSGPIGDPDDGTVQHPLYDGRAIPAKKAIKAKADCRSGRSVKAAWAVTLLLVPLLAQPVGAEATGEAVLPLYLLPMSGGEKNLTTFPPETAEAVLDPPNLIVTPFHFYWDWRLVRSPEVWTLTPGDRIEAVLYFEGLDRVVPFNNRLDPAQLGKMRIDVDLFTHGSLYTGVSSWDEPLQEKFSNATGTTLIDPPFLEGPGAVRVVVPLEVPEATTVWTHFEFALRVAVSGTALAEDRPHIRLAGQDAASQIVIEGFPAAAFRAWEVADLEARDCNELILRGERCTQVDTEVPTAPVVEVAPGPSALLALVAFGLWVRLSNRGPTRTRHRR